MESMMRTTRMATRLAAAVLLGVLVSGCSTLFGSAEKPAPGVSTSDSTAIGYTLVYSFVSTQKNSDKLLIIKAESDKVDEVITRLSDTAKWVNDRIVAFAEADPAIVLDKPVLPLIEQKQRQSAQLERAKQFLGTTGRDFERLLLLTQSGVLTTERHLAEVMADEETDPVRKKFWEDAYKAFDARYEEVYDLLKADYFS